MKTISVNVDTITIPERHRHLDPAKVDPLAESIGRLGLQQPISVWVDTDTATGELDVILVAGRHRLEAVRKLGWSEVDAVEVELDATDRELWEIDENLMRSELTTEEKREHLRRRKELWERRQEEKVASESGAPCATLPKTGRGNRGFAADTAASTGLSKSQINRLLAEPKPRETLEERSRTYHTLPAEPLNDLEASNKAKSRLIAAWNSAPPEIRDWFRDWIDAPVADQTRAAS